MVKSVAKLKRSFRTVEVVSQEPGPHLLWDAVKIDGGLGGAVRVPLIKKVADLGLDGG
jgi:hypothetical protein